MTVFLPIALPCIRHNPPADTPAAFDSARSGFALLDKPGPLQFRQSPGYLKPVQRRNRRNLAVRPTATAFHSVQDDPLMQTEFAGLPEALSRLVAGRWIVRMAARLIVAGPLDFAGSNRE
jgi:hypothetical protein